MPKKTSSLVGIRFNRLIVLSEELTPDLKSLRPRKWICKCDCGITKSIAQQSLKNQNTTSCGCYNKEKNTTHGDTKTRLYGIWMHMRKRCSNTNHHAYSLYGGAGITVCIEWENSYENFKKWAIQNGYSENLSIDRIDGTKGYFPENCRWATQLTQARNTKGIKNSSSIYKGVSFIEKDKSYQVSICVKGIHHYLGRYKDEVEAAKVYNQFIINNNLENCYLNKV